MKNLFVLLVCFILQAPKLFAFNPIPALNSSLNTQEINETNCADLLNKEARSVTDFSLLKFQKSNDFSDKNLTDPKNTFQCNSGNNELS